MKSVRLTNSLLTSCEEIMHAYLGIKTAFRATCRPEDQPKICIICEYMMLAEIAHTLPDSRGWNSCWIRNQGIIGGKSKGKTNSDVNSS